MSIIQPCTPGYITRSANDRRGIKGEREGDVKITRRVSFVTLVVYKAVYFSIIFLSSFFSILRDGNESQNFTREQFHHRLS